MAGFGECAANITICLRLIRNAWHFHFDLVRWLRSSLLNAALYII